MGSYFFDALFDFFRRQLKPLLLLGESRRDDYSKLLSLSRLLVDVAILRQFFGSGDQGRIVDNILIAIALKDDHARAWLHDHLSLSAIDDSTGHATRDPADDTAGDTNWPRASEGHDFPAIALSHGLQALPVSANPRSRRMRRGWGRRWWRRRRRA